MLKLMELESRKLISEEGKFTAPMFLFHKAFQVGFVFEELQNLVLATALELDFDFFFLLVELKNWVYCLIY